MKELRKYENIIILRNSSEDEYKKMLENIMEKVKKLVIVNKIEELGIRNLAYEIKNNKQAYYIIIHFEATNEVVEELQRVYRITDDVIKFLIVSIDD